MKDNLILLLMCLLLSSYPSVADPSLTDPMLFLRHKGADMPVWVKGNTTTKTILLVLHGGPGTGSFLYQELFSRKLEKNYLVAYWDQRAAGSSQGRINTQTLTREQYTEDLLMVVKLLHLEFPDYKLFLLGHSFGVELGIQFLTTENYQNLVSGAILVDGTHSMYTNIKFLREWLMREIEKRIADGDKKHAVDYEWLQNHPVPPENVQNYDFVKVYYLMTQLGGDDGIAGINLVKPVFFSPLSLSTIWNIKKGAGADPNKVVQRFERANLLHKITRPIKLLWGRNDGNVPLPVGEEMYQLLVNTERELVVFEQSKHSPMLTETEKFSEEVIHFVEKYRNK
jgi:pimeloyl-ACP methyl ester carboxylesterase